MPEETAPALTHNEVIKAAIPTLAGTIAATLHDPAADRFAADDEQFLKFHGIYQQDDRDLRKTGKKYMMMIRGRIPGGVMTPAQWITFDDLATNFGNNTLRLTTRQSIQFHGVLKSGLGPLIRKINESLLSTLAACGDVNRNVMSPPTPFDSEVRREVQADCIRVADALTPATEAYHAIWIDGVQLNLEEQRNKDFVDPLYGKTYLPRKFKTGFAIPPINDVDIFTSDLGFVAIVEDGRLTGYNVTVGGGMGRSHNNTFTYPRLADVLGFATREQLVDVARAVLTVHRDFGDRTNRKHARLKYVVQEKGIDWVRTEVESRIGGTLGTARTTNFTTTSDTYGWGRQLDGRHYLTLFVASGRVKDAGDWRMKSALRAIAEQFPEIEFRISANQNVILADIPDARRAELVSLLEAHGVPLDKQATALHLAAMACPALPTCGLALAESERMLPAVLDTIEALCAEVGMAGEEIVIRSTGCPNGCARPYMAEIALVGRAPGKYQLWIGGNKPGTRLNTVFKEVVLAANIADELRPLLTRWRDERNVGERFGDFASRVILPELAASAAAAATPSQS
jgi:sulfite reductase (NADPH) hemoprotein beta-component